MKEEKVLQDLGMEERESKVYLHLLKLNSATASKIAQEVGIDRTTTYDVLARLIEKGIVSYVIRNNVKHFKAASPQQLLIDIKQKEKNLQGIMPLLLELEKKDAEETTVEVFKGKEGMLAVMKMQLREGEDYSFIGGGHDFCRSAPSAAKRWLIDCEKSGIKARLICEEGFGDHEVDIVGKHEEYRFLSKELVSSSIQIWGNKTAFYIFSNPIYVIVITSQEVADKQRLFFDYLWKQARKPTKKDDKRLLID